MCDSIQYDFARFPSPPGTFLLSIMLNILEGFKTLFPSPPGTFLLSIKRKKRGATVVIKFPSPPGTFLLSMEKLIVTQKK